MFWFRRDAPAKPLATSGDSRERIATVPAGQRVYVFGDVHGRRDLVDRLIAAIRHHHKSYPCEAATVVGLGDYVDRGPDSHGVVERLAGGIDGCRMMFIRGNHEQMLIEFLENPAQVADLWLGSGGADTLSSYGVLYDRGLTGSKIRELRDEFARRLPPRHIRFLSGLRPSITIGDYFFCHAGARAGVPLDDQAERDLIWIRHKSGAEETIFERIVVHGHTAIAEPFLGVHRINIDTGAYVTGKLTCLVLEGRTRTLLDI